MHILARLIHVNFRLWSFVIWWSWQRTGIFRSKHPASRRFAGTLERLGTTFVKLGQALSLHGEFLPDEFVSELRKLQDHVAPFPFAKAREEIEKSFGRSLKELFHSFDSTPLAAGSIAQVHRATLPHGKHLRQVIVKVRRPGIKRQIQDDIRILRWFLHSAMFFVRGLRRYRPLELLDELERNLNKEIDFRYEAMSIQRFGQVFKNSRSVSIPGIVNQMYSEWILVQELSQGKRIDHADFKRKGRKLARILVDAFLHQFFVAGIFHGDPHPGNVFVLKNGRICLIDFGLVGYLDETTRTNLLGFMQAFAQHDPEWLLDTCVDLGILSGSLNREEFVASLDEWINENARMPFKDWSLGAAFIKIARMGRGQNIRVPHHLLVFLRSLFLMESTLRELDPDFNLLDDLFHRAKNKLGETADEEDDERKSGALWSRFRYESLLALKQMPNGISKLLQKLRTKGFEIAIRHHGFGRVENEIRWMAMRMSLALISLGLFIAGSLLVQNHIGPVVFGIPIPATLAYGLALYFTFRVLRVSKRQGDE